MRNLKQYMKLSEYAKLKSVTYTTAWNHYKKGIIDGAYKDKAGNVLIPIDNFIDYKKCVIYSRVSSSKMKENLTRQQSRLEEFAISNGYEIIKSVKEIASGMNDNRSKLIKLLKDQSWNTLIVEHKDRLTRFGFNYLETLLNINGKKIVVINPSKNDKEDLMSDLISIIYSFSARMYGLRGRKKKKEIIDFLS